MDITKIAMDTVKKLKRIEFLDGLYFATIITSLFAVSKGISLSQIVIAQGIYSVTIVFMEVPTGLIADKFGRKTSMALGYLASALGIIFFTLAPSVIALYVMRFLQSTGSALVSGANEALLFEAANEANLNYKKESSKLNSNSIIGLCIAGIIAGIIYQIFGSSSFIPLLVLSALVQLLAFFYSLMIKEGRKKAKNPIVEEELKAFEILSSTVKMIKNNKI